MEENKPKLDQPSEHQNTDLGWEVEPHGGPIPTESTGQNQLKSRKKLLILVSAALILVVGGVVAWFLTKDDAKTTPTNNQPSKVSVQLGWLHQAQFAGMYVAKEKGFYSDAGLDVALKEYQDGIDINNEVAAAKAQFGTSTPLEVMASIDKGDQVKAVAAIYQTSPYTIVSPKSSNIEAPADFKGKVLGSVGDNPQAAITYPLLMTEAGLTDQDATIKTVDFDVVKVFKDKDADTADIYRTDQTYALDQAGIEYNLLYPEQFGFDIYGDVIVASNQLISQDPALVEKFVQATLKGWQYAIDHQDEALSIVAKYENELYKDPAYEKHILSESVPLIKPTGDQPLGNMQFVPWNRAYQAVKAGGSLKTNIEVTNTYTSQFVE